ncbi:hypothetical protein CN988_25340 [Bacillus thuringiensis]|nr:hypothetical protein CN486_22935 [Bacillus thuringiensis]PES39801.1 hypothetical protein CN499_31510 [Bacillus thuringiensis]PEV53051.1 hypothetical protein CN432_04235 [Bacillus thuringiensis]PEV54541.1 hypothetical protein CN434_33245 [Bacillus thuringiensis]PEZ29113.1 hypothetical protein CN346_25580 [Bacillus thuringiensis]
MYGGVITDDGLLSFFLITMAGIALFFYIQHAGKPTKRNKWKFLIIVFLFYLLNYLFLKFL